MSCNRWDETVIKSKLLEFVPPEHSLHVDYIPLGQWRGDEQLKNYPYPVVMKPDLYSTRSVGAKRIDNITEARAYLEGAQDHTIVQAFHPGPKFVGAYYFRDPDTGKESIVSMVENSIPDDDGHSEYFTQKRIFTSRPEWNTPAFQKSLFRWLRHIPGFHAGRLDIMFKDPEELMKGKGYHVIEINGSRSRILDAVQGNLVVDPARFMRLESKKFLFGLKNVMKGEGWDPSRFPERVREAQRCRQILERYPHLTHEIKETAAAAVLFSPSNA